MRTLIVLTFALIASIFVSCSDSNGHKRKSHNQSRNTSQNYRSKESVHGVGIDLSHHNAEPDWKSLKADFVIMKATEGSNYVDPTFNKRRKKCFEHKIPVGAYHFFSGRGDAKKEFQNFYKTVGKNIDLIPVLDVEIIPKGVPAKEYVKRADKFLELTYEHYGCYPIIYTSIYFYNKYLKSLVESKRKKSQVFFWSGDVKVNYNKISEPAHIHQVEIRHVPGSKGKVDVNELHIELDKLKYKP